MNVIAFLHHGDPRHAEPLREYLLIWAHGVDCPPDEVLAEWIAAHSRVFCWRPVPGRGRYVEAPSGGHRSTNE